MAEIRIRKADSGDAGEIAALFMLAWPVEDILASSGMTREELHLSMTHAAAREDTIYGFINTFVAETDGKIIGAVCAYDGADYQRLKQPIVEAIGHDSGFARIKETEAGEFYVDSVGVLPEYRGRGTGTRLVEAQIRRAASLGHSVIGLIVDIDKPKTEALYTRLGFKHLDDRNFFGHTMKHMVKVIRPDTALVLEGGGLRGVFTCGVLDCFMDHGIRFPFIVGVSAGACNGLSYMSGQRGRARSSNIDLMEKYHYVGLKYLLTQGCIMDFKLLFEDFPERIIPYDYPAYFANPDRFVMVTTNCLTGRAEYFEEKTSAERVMDIVRASSSLPFVSKITYVDGIPMLDGGIVDSIPVRYAMEQGYEHPVVVLTRNKGYRKKDSKMRLSKAFYRRYPHLQKALARRNATYNSTMDLIERMETEGTITVIRPERPVEVGRMEKDTAKLARLYQEGYEMAEKYIKSNQS